MSSPINTVALCSATGKLGPFLLSALVAEGFSVTVVSRKSSKATFPPQQRVTVVSDEYNEEELVSAFSGHDAVVLALSFEMLPHSKRFAKASIAAGNRWLIASTYAANLEDPKHHLFPASIPHRQAVDELKQLQAGQNEWGWTSISCGPWPELSVAAGAWKIDAVAKTAELVDGGRNVFSSTTREQVSLAAARVLKKQPSSMRNNSIYIASFEVNMLSWLDAYKQVVGRDDWKVSNTDSNTLLAQSQACMASGDFHRGYTGLALVVCTSEGYRNQFSQFTALANKELELPEEDLLETVKRGLVLPNPFA